jgi:lipoate-protein ligase A
VNRPVVAAPLVEQRSGPARELHGIAIPDPLVSAVWAMEVTGPALALGSRQTDATVDPVAVTRAGVDVVRRRSGGGAVLLVPGEVVWIDVLVPSDHPSWSDDLHDAMVVMGEVWVAALAASGLPGATVHRGGMQRDAWSDLVCFSGLGPGEVLVGDRKLVGISQRRTRRGARFQCALHRRVDLAETAALLSDPPSAPLPHVAAWPDAPATGTLARAIAAAVRAR